MASLSAFSCTTWSRPLFDSKETLRRDGALRIAETKLAVGHHDGIRQFEPTAQAQRQIRAGKDVDVGNAIRVDRRTVLVGDRELKSSDATRHAAAELQRLWRLRCGNVETDRFGGASDIDAAVADSRHVPASHKAGK